MVEGQVDRRLVSHPAEYTTDVVARVGYPCHQSQGQARPHDIHQLGVWFLGWVI